jgi:hypothetical protein
VKVGATDASTLSRQAREGDEVDRGEVRPGEHDVHGDHAEPVPAAAGADGSSLAGPAAVARRLSARQVTRASDAPKAQTLCREAERGRGSKRNRGRGQTGRLSRLRSRCCGDSHPWRYLLGPRSRCSACWPRQPASAARSAPLNRPGCSISGRVTAGTARLPGGSPRSEAGPAVTSPPVWMQLHARGSRTAATS